MASFFTKAAACAGLAALAAGASAQSAEDDAAVLGLPEALARSLADNPRLTAAGHEIDAAEARLLQAGLKPNPELDASVEDVLGAGRFSGVDSAETTVTLGWVLERGVRPRIVAAARADVSLESVEAELARVDVAAETARRFVDCLALEARRDSAQRAVRLADETVAAVRRRAAAGAAPSAELARAEAARARAELVQEDVEHELLSAYRRLSAQWGETEPDFSSVAGELMTLPRVGSFDALAARIDRNPDLARFASRRRLDEAQLRLAEARARPSWRIYAGIRRVESTDDAALVGGVTVPLVLRDRNQGRIAEARANRAQTEAEETAARVDIETTLFALHQEFQHSLHVIARLQRDVVPRIETALDETRRAYELGRYGYFEWQAVQAELLTAQNDVVDAAVEAHRLLIEIERLTGAGVASPAAERGERP